MRTLPMLVYIVSTLVHATQSFKRKYVCMYTTLRLEHWQAVHAATYCDGHTHLKQAVQGLQDEEGPLLITELQVTAHEEPDSSQLLQTEVPQRLPSRDDVTCMESSPGIHFT